MATIEELLASLGLSKFVDKFHEEEIDLQVANKLTEDELKDLGLTVGARKKLYQALHSGAPAAPATVTVPAIPAPPVIVRATAAPKAPPAAAAPSRAPPPAMTATTKQTRPDAFRWKWNFRGERWPDRSGCNYHKHLRLQPGDEPKLAVVGARGQDEQNHALAVFNITTGTKIKALSRISENRTSVFDFDIYQDIIVSTGDDKQRSNVACFWDANTFEFKGEYRGLHEGGLGCCGLTTSASGALTLVANTDGERNQFMTYDVETTSRCAKALLLNIDDRKAAQFVRRDPQNTGCYLASYHDGLMFYIDSRAGKVVRNIKTTTNTMSVRLPESTPGKGITADRDTGTCIFDIGTGRTIIKLNKVRAECASMNATTAACSDGNKFAFFNIAGAGTELDGPDFDLSYSYSCWDIDMASRVVIGIGSGELMSASL